jgi:glycosyltransferase involved in cell wall biosynthesis
VARLGSDHVDAWPRRTPDRPYAITFGQWGNKNADLVIDAWAALQQRGDAMPLSIVGLPSAARGQLQQAITDRGLRDVVTLLPWLPDEDFRSAFASAALVVFPSDFEGFGLPAVEAMRLGIPLVISRDPALREVTGSHASVMSGFTTDALVAAVGRARAVTPDALARARAHVMPLTWDRTAGAIRATLCEAIDGRRDEIS